MRMRPAVLGLALTGLATIAAHAATKAPAAFEVRLEARQGGEPFSFADGHKVMLEPVALLEPRHFSSIEMRGTRNPNTPGTFEIEAVHSERGRQRLQAAAGFARERRTCVLRQGVVQSCSGFAPAPRHIYDRGQVMQVPSQSEARAVAARLERAIAADRASEHALTAQTQVATPRQLLDLLYRRTLKAGGSTWFEDGGREAFLSRSLVELWDKADARIASGDNDAVLDADPVAATNGLELKSYRIAFVSQTATLARARVTVGYGSGATSRHVGYSLVRERGHWRIADIGTGASSLKASLARFVDAPADASSR